MEIKHIITAAIIVWLLVISYRWFIFAFIFDSDVDSSTVTLTMLWWCAILLYSFFY